MKHSMTGDLIPFMFLAASKGTHCWVREQIGQDQQGRGWQKRQRHNFPKAPLGWNLDSSFIWVSIKDRLASKAYQMACDGLRWVCFMRLCPRPPVLQQILAKDSHSHEDDIANGLWMTLARQTCTCCTKIKKRKSNSHQFKKDLQHP